MLKTRQISDFDSRYCVFIRSSVALDKRQMTHERLRKDRRVTKHKTLNHHLVCEPHLCPGCVR